MSRTAEGRAPRVVRVNAFAKINLSLRVLGARADGYHELRTTFQSLALHDTLTFTERKGPFQIVCDNPACPVDANNLVWRAAERLWRVAGHRSALTGLSVRIAKKIPMQAGLGGGSSDAAAAIRALAAWWRIDLRARRVRQVAADLGADVPFFLHGGTALGVGRGDVLVPIPDALKAWVVLVLPAFGVSTAEAYRWWDKDQRAARGPSPAPGASPAGWTNDLEPPVARRHPQIARIGRALLRHGASHAAMSGSGSAVFGLFASRARAKAAAAAMGTRSCRVLMTRTLSRARHERETRCDVVRDL